jgi:glycosyltransferase involved in cell wall biosynthesis
MRDEPGAFRPWMEARLMALAGYKVTVVTSGIQYMTGTDIRNGKGWCVEEISGGIRILRIWGPSDHRRSIARRLLNYTNYALLAGLAALVKVGRVDRVFVGTDPIFIMPIAYLMASIKKAKLILDERDLYPETAVALRIISNGILFNLLFSMQQLFRKKAVSILAATPGIQKRIIHYGHSAEKVYLLYNADIFIDEDLTNRPYLFTLKKKTGKSFIVGYAGGLGKVNDIPVLLRAASRLVDIKDIGVVIIGSGERFDEFIKFCNDNGLTNVFFFDAVPRKKVRQFLKEFDLCVQPLPNNDHFFHTLTSKTFDYHGVGRPMILCGSGNTADLIRQSKGGLSVLSGDDRALANSIRELYLDKKRCRRMGKMAREWYDRNISLQAGKTLFQKILS